MITLVREIVVAENGTVVAADEDHLVARKAEAGDGKAPWATAVEEVADVAAPREANEVVVAKAEAREAVVGGHRYPAPEEVRSPVVAGNVRAVHARFRKRNRAETDER